MSVHSTAEFYRGRAAGTRSCPAVTGEKTFWGDPDYGGLAKMACHLSLVDEESEQHRPSDGKLFVFNTCRQFIRTVPVLPCGDIDMDDVDSAAEDHAGEARIRPRDERKKTGPQPLRMSLSLRNKGVGIMA